MMDPSVCVTEVNQCDGGAPLALSHWLFTWASAFYDGLGGTVTRQWPRGESHSQSLSCPVERDIHLFNVHSQTQGHSGLCHIVTKVTLETRKDGPEH